MKGYSWKRAIGISGAKSAFARATGIPTTKQGRKRKIERSFFNLFSKNKMCLLSVFHFIIHSENKKAPRKNFSVL